MRIWKAKPSFFLEYKEGNARILLAGREVLWFDLKWNKTEYTMEQRPAAMILGRVFRRVVLPWGEEGEMVLRWNPKPVLCFQRKDHGVILVAGKQVIQFDKEWNRVNVLECITFLQACRQGLLVVGATDGVEIETGQGNSGVLPPEEKGDQSDHG